MLSPRSCSSVCWHGVLEYPVDLFIAWKPLCASLRGICKYSQLNFYAEKSLRVCVLIKIYLQISIKIFKTLVNSLEKQNEFEGTGMRDSDHV